ncbi:uncharacterized protein LOC131666739 [Phymastichus coffea]|uniref:uncharacterized protein LOC131666739 n=1 Tax=Phymastichus coffea TaxID=108790 RepID=UPI00273AB265|nr:uncharacterized protein LOC131666739 [Phymastichus coffea]
MFRYIFFVSLWLVVTSGSDVEWLTAPEKLDDTVARLLYTEVKDEWQHIFRIQVETLPFITNIPERQCFFDLVSRPLVAVMNINTFRRLNKNLIVLSWDDEMTYGYYHKTKIAILNMNNCMKVNLNMMMDNAIIIPSADSLDIFFLDSMTPCLFSKNNYKTRSIYRCWYSYSIQDMNTTHPKLRFAKEFDVDLDWSSIRIERLPSEDFVVRGFQGLLYRVMRMEYSSGELHTLISVPSANRHLQMVSKGLSFCWIRKLTHDKGIYCDQFNDENELVFSTEASFNQSIIIMYVQSDYEGHISCLVAKAECTDPNDCWTFTRKSFYREGNKTIEDTISINCRTRNRNNWVFFGFERNSSDTNMLSFCTRSGYSLGTGSECHVDASDQMYCL